MSTTAQISYASSLRDLPRTHDQLAHMQDGQHGVLVAHDSECPLQKEEPALRWDCAGVAVLHRRRSFSWFAGSSYQPEAYRITHRGLVCTLGRFSAQIIHISCAMAMRRFGIMHSRARVHEDLDVLPGACNGRLGRCLRRLAATSRRRRSATAMNGCSCVLKERQRHTRGRRDCRSHCERRQRKSLVSLASR